MRARRKPGARHPTREPGGWRPARELVARRPARRNGLGGRPLDTAAAPGPAVGAGAHTCAPTQTSRSAVTCSRLVSLSSSWRAPGYRRRDTSHTPARR